MSKHPMWLRRGIALTLALVMTASLSVSALAAPSVEEAGEDTVLSQTQLTLTLRSRRKARKGWRTEVRPLTACP